MNMEKLTNKSQQALSGAHQIAVDLNHQELSPMHLMAALVRQKAGLIPSLLQKLSVLVADAESAVDEILKKRPSVSGLGVQTYTSRALTAVLSEAQRVANRMKDEY